VSSYEGSPVVPGRDRRHELAVGVVQPNHETLLRAVADSCGIFTAQRDDPLRSDNRWMGGTARGTLNPDVQAAFDKLTEDYPGGTFVRAMDPFTGKKVWDYAGGAGVLSTAGGLIFMPGAGGMTALDAKTGKLVWQLNVGQGSSAAPITYMLRRQAVHRAGRIVRGRRLHGALSGYLINSATSNFATTN
jgi:outer membrane protein assembly factor BamB